MEYQIISKRFRPQLFTDVYQQHHIITTLKNAIELHRVSQAYLFCGSRGSGKTTLARLFAKALNCANRSNTTEPCNRCASCEEITIGTSLDVIEIDGASNRGIDDIRQLTETVGYMPTSGKYKIYIIDEVHMLTKEAFNALLKTLEEPPAHVKFFFATTEPHKLPTTILSRCQRFNLHRIQPETIAAKLRIVTQTLGIAIESEALGFIAQLADGSLRDAESILDQLLCFMPQPITYKGLLENFGIPDHSFLSGLDEIILANDKKRALLLGREVYSTGKDIIHTLDRIQHHFQSHLYKTLGITPGKSPFTVDQLVLVSTFIEEKKQFVLDRTSHQHHVEAFFVELIIVMNSRSLEHLVTRLEHLEEKIAQAMQQPAATLIAPAAVEAPLPLPKEIPPAVQPPLLATLVEASPPAPVIEASSEGPNDIQKFERLLRFAGVELNGTVRKK